MSSPAPAPLSLPRPRTLRGRPSRHAPRHGRYEAPTLPGIDDGVTRLVDLALLLTDLRTRMANERNPMVRQCLAMLIQSAEARS